MKKGATFDNGFGLGWSCGMQLGMSMGMSFENKMPMIVVDGVMVEDGVSVGDTEKEDVCVEVRGGVKRDVWDGDGDEDGDAGAVVEGV